jgi:exonuclease III
VTIFVQINGIKYDKGPRGYPRRPKYVKVPEKVRNFGFLDLGKRTTIITTTTDLRKKKVQNVIKWLKGCFEEVRTKLGVNDNDDNERGPDGVRNWIKDHREKIKISPFCKYLFLKFCIVLENFEISRNVLKGYNVSKRESGHSKLINTGKSEVFVMVHKSESENVSDDEKTDESVEGEREYEQTKAKIFCVSVAIMVSVTIALLLLQQTVERNPGPKSETSILTYNTNGLRDNDKLKRLLKKIDPMINNGGLALLQETHIVNTDYLRMIWKHKFVSNCVSTNSAGVMILYNNEFKLIDEYADKEGRILIVALKSENKKSIVVNTYYPNDHRQSLTFADNLYEEILKFQQNYPEFDTIYTGDINTCLTSGDCLNRNRTKVEEALSTLIQENNKVINVLDAFRAVNPTGGYTWKRNNCYSRLDYVFLSKSMKSKIVNVKIDWAYETSDHAALIINLKEEAMPNQGPGLAKINTKILEDPEVSNQIEKEIVDMMSQTDNSWNPHLKLEFLKVCIRSVFASKVNDIKRETGEDIKNMETELNQIEELKIDILNKHEKEKNNMGFFNVQKIEIAISSLKNRLKTLRQKMSNAGKFVSKAKWFEYGEKPNKFFLNLNKGNQRRKLISTIRNGGEEKTGQREVTECIRDFYSKLYDAQPIENEVNDDFYKYCPKLSENDAKYMEDKLSLADLYKALLTCKDSAPGPDGIPYAVYKKYWKILGNIILEAWNFSIETEKLTVSHTESAITLLPKEGKDGGDIKNWRPITLSNCDSKIITKALSIKMSKILNTIIDPSQTAYVPGRAVADNLRANFFFKDLCKQNNVNSALISLDAKKAFDSVDHEYIKRTLAEYGFGVGFIKTFQVLYKNITARIMINGYASDPIQIKRGVKQGDALSCAIFIICIDPLLRNLNKNRKIGQIKVGKYSGIRYKAAAYADDISIMCKNDKASIQEVFNEYGKLTRRSGLELNADKTEILILNDEAKVTFNVNYNRSSFNIETVDNIKICGLFFCTSKKEEYERNVHDKIKKLTNKIRAWSHRHLTMEGKSLIVKTFGLSQLIYNMQAYNYEKAELDNIEKIIFKFLWSKTETQNGIDRIRRSVMKNDYQNGGMSITDVDCLNRSLKLRQFFRARTSNHAIAEIQKITMGSDKVLNEYIPKTTLESICNIALETINIITDYSRTLFEEMQEEMYENDTLTINGVSSINLKKYFRRKSKTFISCMLITLTNNGICSLGELTQAFEFEIDTRLSKSMKIILQNIPEKLRMISRCYNENINSDEENMTHIMTTHGEWLKLDEITVKQLQIILKKAMSKVESLDVSKKVQIQDFNCENIVTFREQCKNPKLRNIYFRLIHNDFFPHSRMKKYKMTNSDKCPRCDEVETTKHMLWECAHVQNIWRLFNELMSKMRLENEHVTIYDDIYKPGKTAAISLIKIRVIQELIQIVRPTNWDEGKMKNICNELLKMEKYNAMTTRTNHKFIVKWQKILQI